MSEMPLSFCAILSSRAVKESIIPVSCTCKSDDVCSFANHLMKFLKHTDFLDNALACSNQGLLTATNSNCLADKEMNKKYND